MQTLLYEDSPDLMLTGWCESGVANGQCGGTDGVPCCAHPLGIQEKMIFFITSSPPYFLVAADTMIMIGSANNSRIIHIILIPDPSFWKLPPHILHTPLSAFIYLFDSIIAWITLDCKLFLYFLFMIPCIPLLRHDAFLFEHSESRIFQDV